MHVRRRAPRLLLTLALLSAACATTSQRPAEAGAPVLPSPMLVAPGSDTVLFIGPEAGAARIAYLSPALTVEVAGAAEQGRVPVRVEGLLRARGYVPEDALRLRVQRRGRLRGAPIYVGPNDLLQVLGPSVEPGRVAVRARIELAGTLAGAFEGTYPSVGLAARPAPPEAAPPPAARRYELPAGTALPLFELPGQGQVAELPARATPLPLEVLNEQQGWSAVRAGTGPYLIGWAALAGARELVAPSEAPYVPEAAPSQPRAGSSSHADARSGGAQAPSALPARIAAEPGELRRVNVGTKVVFGQQVIAVFKAPGWARVLKSYESGYADVFAAVNGDLAVRGLVRTSDLASPH